MDILKGIIIRGIYFLILGGIVYFLTLKLKFKYNGWDLNNPRKNAIYALAATCTSVFLIVIIILIYSRSISNSTSGIETNVTYNFSIVLSNIILYLVIISPVLLTKKFLKQSWTSTGISKRNLKNQLPLV